MSDGGKGSAPRQQRDDDKFRENWEKIFGGKKVTTVYKFYADWCQPCKQLSKVLEDIDHKHTLVEVDITSNENKPLIVKYGITSIPTLVRADTEEKLAGFVSKKALEVFLND